MNYHDRMDIELARLMADRVRLFDFMAFLHDEINPAGLEKDYVELSHQGFSELEKKIEFMDDYAIKRGADAHRARSTEDHAS